MSDVIVAFNLLISLAINLTINFCLCSIKLNIKRRNEIVRFKNFILDNQKQIDSIENYILLLNLIRLNNLTIYTGIYFEEKVDNEKINELLVILNKKFFVNFFSKKQLKLLDYFKTINIILSLLHSIDNEFKQRYLCLLENVGQLKGEKLLCMNSNMKLLYTWLIYAVVDCKTNGKLSDIHIKSFCELEFKIQNDLYNYNNQIKEHLNYELENFNHFIKRIGVD